MMAAITFPKLFYVQKSFCNLMHSSIRVCVHTTSVLEKQPVNHLEGFPALPKKPANPFSRFVQENKAVFKGGELRKGFPPELLSQWTNMEESRKQEMTREFQEKMKEWKDNCDNILSQLSEEERKQFHAARLKERHQRIHEKKRRKLKKAEKAFGKPKASRPAFLYFVMDHYDRSKVGKERSVTASQTQMKELSVKWTSLSDSEKQKYREMAKTDVERYATELQEWEGNMLEQGRLDLLRRNTVKELGLATEKKAKKKRKRKKKKAKKLSVKQKKDFAEEKRLKNVEMGKPKRPLTTFSLFMKDRAAERAPTDMPGHFLKHCADQWAMMSASEKQIYQNKAKAESKKYEEDLAEWEDRMIEDGNIDLVRGKVLAKMKKHDEELGHE